MDHEPVGAPPVPELAPDEQRLRGRSGARRYGLLSCCSRRPCRPAGRLWRPLRSCLPRRRRGSSPRRLPGAISPAGSRTSGPAGWDSSPGTQATPAGGPLLQAFTTTGAESQAPPNTARCASVACTVGLAALPARHSPAGTGRFRGGPRQSAVEHGGTASLADGTFVFPQWDRLMRGQLRGAGLARSPDRVSRPSGRGCPLQTHPAHGCR